ncbi:AMP-binding protein [bacterium]|jgi:long-chain acyl-CoA synthetase|nr:AMP-binding protein [bacterium]MBT5015108.1 AMP-binding protein [bacterium]
MILSELIAQNVKNCGDRVAFTMKFGYRTKNLTYKELYTLARQVALFLQSHGLKKGDKVLLLAPNSPYWGAVYWGCVISGIILVPLNIQSTAEMLARAAEQTEAPILFKNLFYKQDLPKDVKAFDIEFLDELVQEFDAEKFKAPDIKPDDLVQIMYTSGTTGDPKGVMLSHKNISANLTSLLEVIPFKGMQSERMLSILPLSHIYEQTIGFLLPQRYCAQVVYAHSLGAIRELMQEYKVSTMAAVPEFLHVMMSRIKAGVHKQKKEKVFAKMMRLSKKMNNYWLARNVIFKKVSKQFGGRLYAIASGGAPLDPDLERDWDALGIQILQGYGLTETSPVVTSNSFKNHRLGSVGKPVPGVQVRLGKGNEIFVKGDNVFVGYYKNPEKTKEVLSEDGWFKTGDIGEFDKDGFLYLKGREKYMILGPGGQNVFPEDIEQELNKSDCVKDSAVLGLDHDGGMVEIHAVLLLDPDKKDCVPEKIIDEVNNRLASYQQITGWSVWHEDDFPRSATRKVQKEKVRKHILDNTNENEALGSLNRSSIEKMLAQVSGVSLEKISETSKLGTDLKVDSLMRVELVARIEQDFGVALNEVSLTSQMTVKELQELINKQEPAEEMPQLSKWPRTRWAGFVRRGFHNIGMLLMRSFVKVSVNGLENIKDLDGPVIYMPNHTSVIDAAVLLRALPRKKRLKMSFAAAYDVLYEYFSSVSWLAELGANAFPLPRTDSGNINFGLNNIGKMLDQGFSVGIFPEGKMSETGELLPLKAGAGLIATQMDVPIVPVKIEGASKIIPYDKLLPQYRGKITVTFGKPLCFKRSDSYVDVQKKVYEALKKI